MGYACTGLGVVMVVIGLASIYAFVGPDYRNAPADLTPAQIIGGEVPSPPTDAAPPASQ